MVTAVGVTAVVAGLLIALPVLWFALGGLADASGLATVQRIVICTFTLPVAGAWIAGGYAALTGHRLGLIAVSAVAVLCAAVSVCAGFVGGPVLASPVIPCLAVAVLAWMPSARSWRRR